MGYTALYRKFRPQTFEEMVGQEHITRTLRNQIMSNRVGHAYLFNGGRGTGKTTSAKVLARAINCLNPKDGEPCNLYVKHAQDLYTNSEMTPCAYVVRFDLEEPVFPELPAGIFPGAGSAV